MLTTAESVLVQSDKPIGVLIVDNHKMIADGVWAWLSTTPDIHPLGICLFAEDVMTAIAALSPDIVLLDLLFENSIMQGVDLLPLINGLPRRPKVLVLSAYSTVPYVLSALKGGVDGYILKTSADIELIQALRVIYSGQRLFDPKVYDIVRDYLPAQEILTISGGQEDELTERELEVLELIAQGLSNKEITAKLVISEKTVKKHVSNILRKLRPMDRQQAAVWYRANYPRSDGSDTQV
jgi:DNA-binding NarL/FixJ family response regulator